MYIYRVFAIIPITIAFINIMNCGRVTLHVKRIAVVVIVGSVDGGISLKATHKAYDS